MTSEVFSTLKPFCDFMNISPLLYNHFKSFVKCFSKLPFFLTLMYIN